MTEKMSKGQSFGWGFLIAISGLAINVFAVIVFVLMYLLYFKQKKIDLMWYTLGFMFVLVILFILVVILGIAILFALPSILT